MAEKIDLNGYWDWALPGGMWQPKKVPSSYFCVGVSTFQKQVALALAPGKRAFLCFDGIAYHGKVWFNGARLGEMLPYVSYRFELTGHILEGANLVRVEIEDITADYGPTGGWEDYGGITRDVYIQVYDAVHIADVQWLCTLNESYTAAHCGVNVSLDGSQASAAVRLSVRLSLNRQSVYQGEKVVQTTAVPILESFLFGVENPLLWSPESPVLYDLEVTLDAGESRDVRQQKVGFREFKAVGSRLHLNGQEIYLKGVARHEMWGDDQGFTLSRAQVEQDLKMIKAMGANFVRLVHYPHSRMTIELCDQLGLMATEEPGLWWSDLTDEAICTSALAIMEKTVLRDRNSPSVVAWLLYNECVFNGAEEYLRRGKALCNRLDPGRLVSAANCLDPVEAKRVFDQVGLDFYTMHPYSYEPNLMIKALEVLRGKPAVFTEWGGYLFVDNPNLKVWFKKVISEYAHNRDPKPNLAGMAYWQFQDVFQFSRGLPACVDGSLTEGLVDKYRSKKPMFDFMSDLFAAVDRPAVAVDPIEITRQLAYGEDTQAVIPIDISRQQASGAQSAAWEQVLNNLKVFQSIGQNQPRRTRGPEIIQVVENAGGLKVKLSGRPLILASSGQSITLECGLAARKLYFLGQTSFFDGYPLRGRLGEVIARYTIFYADGTQQVIPLRNGYEMASASMIARTSRIDATAVNTRRVMILHLDEDWEVYQVGCLEVETEREKVIDRIEFCSESDAFNPLLYGVSARV